MRRLLLACLLVLAACQSQANLRTCPDGAEVFDFRDCPVPDSECLPCENASLCQQTRCDVSTGYRCVYDPIPECDGNGICEPGEFPGSLDCPSSCDDGYACTLDAFDFDQELCAHTEIIPCCTNTVCEPGETYVACPQDCQQLLDLRVISFDRRQQLSGAYIDLTGTQRTYLIVSFKITNLGFDGLEELNLVQKKGYLFDPFRYRVETDSRALFNAEYDSGLLPGYLDYNILPLGNTRGGSLLFIVPLNTEHARLIAYDTFGNQLDVSDIY